MLRIIDNTLTGFDHCLPSKEELQLFCRLLTEIGIDAIEISLTAYERMEQLPEEGKYILRIDYLEDMAEYPGFYRYTCHFYDNLENMIPEIQINDTRELIKLRALNHCKELRIAGLDDLMCNSSDKAMEEIRKSLPNTKIILNPENTYHCASALAVQWLLSYGSDATVSYAGHNNNGATEEVMMALRLAARHKTGKDFTVLPRLTALYEGITGKIIGNKKPVIGKSIFKVESGIHADAMSKDPAIYEAYEPACVGGRAELVIGKHSGSKAVRMKLEELKLPVPDDEGIQRILDFIKGICAVNRSSLCDEEFAEIAVKVGANERG
ncbi:homocitrate synthase/isopropylmalate synthase family protein [Anaerocolumna jejuensis]|uniref:homocitrate synthase/isopropylmalate synthase family protein n=1 Tax=Anaerocolumna jejuensis TaxID=259063 RepID=UPI003F7BAF16